MFELVFRLAVLTFEDNLPSLTPLPEGVNRRSDLLRRRQPEQHCCVYSVKVGDNSWDCQEQEENVTSNKVGSVKTHLDRLDDEFTSGLRERVRAETTVEPNTSPPRSVGLVVLKLSGQEDGDEDLEDTPLNRHDRDDTEHSVRGIPKLEEPKELEEGNHTNNRTKVGDGSHGSTELVGVRVELSVSIAQGKSRGHLRKDQGKRKGGTGSKAKPC